MTIAVIQDQRSFPGGTVSSIVLPFSSSITQGSSIHVWATCSSSPTPTFTCADSRNGSYGAVLDFITSPGGQCYGHWVFDNCPAGANSVTVNFGAAVGFAQIIIREISGTSGLDTGATSAGHIAADQINPGTGTDAVSSGIITPSQAPGLISCITQCVVGSASLTPGTGFSLGTAFSGNTQTEQMRYTGASAQAGTWTDANGASNEMLTYAAFFKEIVVPVSAPPSRAVQVPGPGVSPSAMFQFSSFQGDTTFTGFPPVTAAIFEGADYSTGVIGAQIGLGAAITEGTDFSVASIDSQNSCSASIVEGSDYSLGAATVAGVVVAAAILEGADFSVSSVQSKDLVTAAILEGRDTASGTIALIDVVSANVTERADFLASFASAATIASAAILEGADAINATLIPFTTISAHILEGRDSTAASAGVQTSFYATIVEGRDIAAGASRLISFASANIVESSDYLTQLRYVISLAVEATDTLVAGLTLIPAQYGFAQIIAVNQDSVFQPAQPVFLEDTTVFIEASWFSIADTPFQPNAVRYRVDDVGSGANILPWTDADPAPVTKITLRPTNNFMVSNSRECETHQVLFQITDGVGGMYYARVKFDINQVVGLPEPNVVMCKANIVEGSDAISAHA